MVETTVQNSPFELMSPITLLPTCGSHESTTPTMKPLRQVAIKQLRHWANKLLHDTTIKPMVSPRMSKRCQSKIIPLAQATALGSISQGLGGLVTSWCSGLMVVNAIEGWRFLTVQCSSPGRVFPNRYQAVAEDQSFFLRSVIIWGQVTRPKKH